MTNGVQTPDNKPLILLTGATGYIGGRLLTLLEENKYRIRCLVRRPDYLKPRVALGTEVVQGDVLDKNSLGAALQGVHSAYYRYILWAPAASLKRRIARLLVTSGRPPKKLESGGSSIWVAWARRIPIFLLT
jgi:hypothetical protein